MKWNKFITDLELFSGSQCSSVNYRYQLNVPGESLTTFKIGGNVSFLLDVYDFYTLYLVQQFLKTKGQTFRVIGNGSNLVISKRGIDDLLLRIISKNNYIPIKKIHVGTEFDRDTHEEAEPGISQFFRVSAGSSVIGLSREFSKKGLSGFEFAAGIPGSMGGAVTMNAGAHGKQFSDIISSVKILCEDGSTVWLSNEELCFSYRHSKLPINSIVTDVDVKLEMSDPEVVKDNRIKALNYRKLTQPLHLPSAGSVFRNPNQNLSAGEILDKLNFKGHNSGGIAFSDLHANWLVKMNDEADSDDVKFLIDLAKERALKEYNISLTEEIIFWDD